MKSIAQSSLIKIALALVVSFGLTEMSHAVNTISHAETLGSNGAITTSSSTVPTAGGVTIGYFNGTAPSDAVIQSWALPSIVSNLIANNWVDVRSVGGADAGMQNGGDWDWPGGGNPGTAGTKIGGTYNFTFNAGVAGRQLYLFAFNAGSSGFGYNASAVVAPTPGFFTISSFSGATEYAILKASTWVLPASDGTALGVRIADVDTISELLVGTETGANSFRDIAMIPEPTTFSLFALGGISLLLMRKKSSIRKVKV